MIDIAARATNSVKIPGRKATCVKIMRTFKTHLMGLRSKLNISQVYDIALSTQLIWTYVGCHCQGHHQYYLWCMAGQQYRRISCSDDPLGWSSRFWWMETRPCAGWLRTIELSSYGKVSWPGLIQSVWTAWNSRTRKSGMFWVCWSDLDR